MFHFSCMYIHRIAVGESFLIVSRPMGKVKEKARSFFRFLSYYKGALGSVSKEQRKKKEFCFKVSSLLIVLRIKL